MFDGCFKLKLRQKAVDDLGRSPLLKEEDDLFLSKEKVQEELNRSASASTNNEDHADLMVRLTNYL